MLGTTLLASSFLPLRFNANADEKTAWCYHVVLSEIWEAHLQRLPRLNRTRIVRENHVLAMSSFRFHDPAASMWVNVNHVYYRIND